LPALLQSPLNVSSTERIVVKNGGKIRIKHLHEILYLEAADDYVKNLYKRRQLSKK
jgi:DNA-binding LytR/AlgR family response regulator